VVLGRQSGRAWLQVFMNMRLMSDVAAGDAWSAQAESSEPDSLEIGEKQESTSVPQFRRERAQSILRPINYVRPAPVALRPITVALNEQAKLRSSKLDEVFWLTFRPMRTTELEFLGPSQKSGMADVVWLIRLADGRCVRATTLLYQVLLFADGQTLLSKIAENVRDATGVDLTLDDVAWLVQHRLAPSGLIEATVPDIAGENGDRRSAADAQVLNFCGGSRRRDGISEETPILASRHRVPLLPFRLTAPITALLQHLFWPPLMALLVIVAIGVNISVVLNPRLLPAVETVLLRPDLILALLGIEFASVLAHELGHASALRRARCRFGMIGIALNAIWPVLYTDVTHVYCLNREQRIRVDLGGIYFQLISTIGMYLIYLATEADVLLLAMFFTSAVILQHFTPFLRLDGYYTVADTLGADEPLARVAALVRERLSWNRSEPRSVPPLRRTAQLVFLGYLLVVAVFLVYPLAVGAFAGSTFVTDFARSGQFYWSNFVSAVDRGAPISIISAYLQGVLWAVIPLGIALFIGRVLRQFANVFLRLVAHGFRLVLPNASMAGAGGDRNGLPAC